jgi:prephenate dehydrogenase
MSQDEKFGNQDKSLDEVRKRIDLCDRQIIELLEKRLDLAGEVARLKEMKSKVALTDPERERTMIRNLLNHTGNQVLKAEIPQIFSICMTMSKRVRVVKHQKEKNRFLPSLKLGIIGLGHFGNMLSEAFILHWPQSELFTCDVKDNKPAEFLSACKADLLFLCVPISALETCLKDIKPHLAETTTVVDVCTVKMYAAQTMERVLGGHRMIATHPMFGPQSSRNGTDFFGLKLVSHNLNAPAFIYDVFTLFWNNLGVQVIEISPEEHDRFAAFSINYNHLVGRIGQEIGLQTTPIDTQGFQVIYDAMHYVTNDTWQLFRDMQNYNPFAEEMRNKVRIALEQIENQLKIQG